MGWIPKNKVVVPLDFSDDSFRALDTALQLVADPKDVLAVHVIQDLYPMEPEAEWGRIDMETRKRHTANALRERLAAEQDPAVSIEVVVGDPGHEIVALAERERADLIVLTSHGRTGLPRILIGSVAERVVRLAHCPVLVLRR